MPPAIRAESAYGILLASCRVNIPTLSQGARQGWGTRRIQGVNTAEAPLSAIEFLYRGGEVGGVEVWPHALCEEEFSVSRLPQQKVGEPLLAASADQEIDVSAACGQCLRQHVAHEVG